VDLDSTVRDLAPRLLAYCFLRSGDPSLAEDLAQEALTALVQRWRHHGEPESPAAFVFAIARRRAGRTLLRRRLWLPLDTVAAVAASWGNPESALLLRNQRQDLLAALSRLSRRDRDVLLLTAVGELSLNEVTVALRISLPAAKMRALRARQRLREILRDGHGSV
jgi:RNA polymerase sigma-70 factor (ECF subfamily)